MLKVVLKYTDCLQDERNVFGILAAHNVKILKTRNRLSIYPKVTICIDDYNKLNDILYDLNRTCSYGVQVVKVKDISK